MSSQQFTFGGEPVAVAVFEYDVGRRVYQALGPGGVEEFPDGGDLSAVLSAMSAAAHRVAGAGAEEGP